MGLVKAGAVALLGVCASAASAQTVCGRNAIERGSVWFLSVHAPVVNSNCQITFNTNRGGFAGNCTTIDVSPNGPPHVGYSSISGTLRITNFCGVRGEGTVTEGPQSQGILLNGQLWASGVGATRPTAGMGLAAGPNIEGVPGFVDWMLVRRTPDANFPDMPVLN